MNIGKKLCHFLHFDLKSERGQSLIEFFILFVFLGLCLPTLLSVSWLLIQKTWIEHQLYQAIVCMAEQHPKIHCESQLREKIKALGHLGELKSLSLSKKKGELVWSFYKQDFTIKQNLGY